VSGRWRIVGIIAFALVTAFLAGYVLMQYRTPVQAVAVASGSAASGIPTETAVTPSAATPSPSRIASIATAINAPDSSILVLGDGSGNDGDEWVSLWARNYLASTRAVTYRALNATGSEFAQKATTFGVAGEPLTVWNASMSDPDMAAEPARLSRLWQSSGVVLLSYGHRQSADVIEKNLTGILAAIRAKDENTAVLVLIQNPDPAASEKTQRAATLAVQRWAAANNLPSVNVYDAFLASPRGRGELVESDGSPTPTGSELFARTLADVLAGV